MGVFFEDDFSGTPGTLLSARTPTTGSTWAIADQENTQNLEIRTGGLCSPVDDAPDRIVYYADAPGDSSLYRAEATIIHTGGGDLAYDCGPTVRQNTGNTRSYRVTTGLGFPRMVRATTASLSTLLVSFTGASAFTADGQTATMKIEAEGTTLRGTYTDPFGDVYTGEAVDTINATGGRPGFWSDSRSFKYDLDHYVASDGAEAGGAITSSGALQAQAATVSGTATVTPAATTITATGALQAQPATLAGDFYREIPASGALQSQAATVAGVATRKVVSIGALQAQPADVSGSSSPVTIVPATGALQAQPATVSGAATRKVVAAGNLFAQPATASGASTRRITSGGVLQSNIARVSGLAPVNGGEINTRNVMMRGKITVGRQTR